MKEHPFVKGDLALCPRLGKVRLLRRGTWNYWVVTPDLSTSYHSKTYEIPPKKLIPLPASDSPL